MQHFVSVDIGASSGRLILGTRDRDQKLALKEVHRFKNGFSEAEGHDRWNASNLVQEILTGLEKVKHQGINECAVGIDTWAVDYCLVDKAGNLLAEPIAYRDKRTEDVMDEFAKHYNIGKLYEKTGIQMQPFNTIFQLFVEDRALLRQADKLLLIPDYLGYVFTGRMVTEKTNASTMQLLNPQTQDWEDELLAAVGVERSLFAPLVDAGTILGALQKEKFPTYDLPEATFISVATHDTASAVLGTPGDGDNWAYISSGTWSLLGVESKTATISRNAFFENYTNEWGVNHTIRFLKNIMGMWLIQEVARMQNYQYSYAELAELASHEAPFQQFVDVNDNRFMNPENMIEELQNYCRETNQKVPATPGEIARCIYDNLALCYACELEKLAELTGSGKKITKLHIVGGGSNNLFLNQLTADVAAVDVMAGPGEATAIGNLVLQMIACGDLADVKEARALIQRSFDYHYHTPQPFDDTMLTNYKKFMEVHKND